MCGIAGWIDWDKDLTEYKDTIRKMGEVMQHRGPDEHGEWFSRYVGFSHRRLIVIDPEGGKQPMIRKAGSYEYVIVYNGELYNTAELRNRLKAKGYTFKGHSDTEVLLLSYIEWGERCAEYLNGIFAFVIWDQRRKHLYMARDRIGVKPLFFVRQEKRLLFASEIKGLLANPLVKPEINQEGLAEILILGPGRTPGRGVFSGIEELKPGYYQVFNKDGLEQKQYWSLESKPHQDSPEETIEKVKWLFEDTVDRQLISDVPICTLLSGGLDSSAITTVASSRLQQQLHTYSVSYKGNEEHFQSNDYQPDSDSKWIKVVSKHAGTRHHPVILANSDLVTGLKAGVYARDLPGMADIDVSLYLFCCEIKKNFTVAVSGECADEIFGGYPWYYNQEALNADTFPWSRKIEERINIFDPEIIDRIKPREYLNQRYREALAEVPRLEWEKGKDDRMRELFYLNLTRWMPVLLDRKDRMSMYTGLEVRVPFCDHRLVEYVWNIPWELKNYEDMRKGILRGALKGILPESIRTRPKNPYPKTFDPEYFKATRDWILEIINDENAPIKELINIEVVKELTRADQDLDIPWFGQLMRLPQLFAYLIQVNFWLEEYDVKIV